ncbi:MAG: hypothetical protein VCB25_05155, partial [Myxococcota bacterium]
MSEHDSDDSGTERKDFVRDVVQRITTADDPMEEDSDFEGLGRMGSDRTASETERLQDAMR